MLTAAFIATTGLFLMLLAIHLGLRPSRPQAPPPPLADFNAIACASITDGIVIQTLDGVIIWVNPAYLTLMQRTSEEVIGRNPLGFCLLPGDPRCAQDIADFRYDPEDSSSKRLYLEHNQRGDGTTFWNELTVSFHRGTGGQTLAVLVCRDVTDQVEQDRALRESARSLSHMAGHDSLTGLANRNTFNTFIAGALAGPPAKRAGFGVLQIDLDKFKAINDRYGHAAGDAALQHVATTISHNLRQTDLLARLGGDEFVAVCAGVSQDSELLRIGRNLCDAMRPPFHFDGHEIEVSISVGAAVADIRDTHSDSLLQKSDFALYEVKRTGRGTVAIYDSVLHAQVQSRDRLSSQLREAIESGGLSFYFQPTIDLLTNKVRGFEALARWQHPTRGLMHPSVFLPIARELNLLKHVDLAAIDAAADLRKRLEYNGFHDVRVGINGSHHLLEDAQHAALIPAHVGRVGVQTRHFVLEFAEREVFGDPDRITDHLSAISRLVDYGFSVLIDGFGAGYAGLLHIERLAVAGFKIEKALIRHLDTAPACARITAMLLQFGDEKKIYCVASGIETAEQADMVRAIGGTVGQGNHFARAMPSEDVIGWLRQRKANPRLRSVG